MAEYQEEWRPVLGLAGLYEVSSFGNVRGVQRDVKHRSSHMRVPGRDLSGTLSHGYRIITFCSGGKHDRRSLHSVVLESFVGPRPDGLVCRHLNGDKEDNSIWNLEWCTQQENMNDTIRHGTRQLGEDCNNSTLSNFGVRVIKRLLSSGLLKQCEIADVFSVDRSAISDIKTGKTWGWLQ